MGRELAAWKKRLPAAPSASYDVRLFSDRLVHSRCNLPKGHWMTSPSAIVRYWQSVELLQPMPVPKLKQRANTCIHAMSAANLVMPRDKASVLAKQSLPEGKKWSHLLFGHCYDSKLAVKALEVACGAVQARKEPQSVTVALFFTPHHRYRPYGTQ